MDDTPLNAAREFPDEPQRPELPREVLGASSWTGIVGSAALAGVVFLLLNLAASDYLGRFGLNRGYWIIHQKWTLLDAVQQPVDTLFVGDSSCNQGLDPETWQASTGESALNLCTIGDMIAYDDVWMVERYIAKHGAPKRVVVAHVYDVWWRTLAEPLLGQVPETWGFWGDSRAPVHPGWVSQLRIVAARFFPMYSQNASLRQAAQRFIADPADAFERSFELTDRGFMPWRESAEQRVEDDLQRHVRFLRKHDFTMSRGNQEALDALSQLADEHGFALDLVRSPTYEALAADEKWQSYNRAIDESLAEWARKSPKTSYFPTIHTFGKSVMENTDHVTESAAFDYTRAVVRDVSETTR